MPDWKNDEPATVQDIRRWNLTTMLLVVAVGIVALVAIEKWVFAGLLLLLFILTDGLYRAIEVNGYWRTIHNWAGEVLD